VDLIDIADFLKSPTIISQHLAQGVSKVLREKILDAFSDSEAYTLMLTGYRMMTDEVQTSLSHLPFTDDSKVQWDFLAVRDVALRTPNKELEHAELLRQLDVGAKLVGVVLNNVSVRSHEYYYYYQRYYHQSYYSSAQPEPEKSTSASGT